LQGKKEGERPSAGRAILAPSEERTRGDRLAHIVIFTWEGEKREGGGSDVGKGIDVGQTSKACVVAELSFVRRKKRTREKKKTRSTLLHFTFLTDSWREEKR